MDEIRSEPAEPPERRPDLLAALAPRAARLRRSGLRLLIVCCLLLLIPRLTSSPA